MEIHFRIIGVLLILLAFIHIAFPKYFNWRQSLQSLNLINKQMMVVHTFFIALTIFLMGLLCEILPSELINTRLGKGIVSGLAFFWVVRLFFQLFVYSSQLWKGKKFETGIHILFTVLWVYFSCIFLLAVLK